MSIAGLGRPALTRTEQFLGRTFRVVPAVLVRSQVLHNNLGWSFLPAEEITDDWAQEWNGIPVLVGPHPTERGQGTSGRSPELWDTRGVGWIFHARAEAEQESPGIRRLVAEVWLDEARADVVPGFKAILDRVKAGQLVELSTGFATQIEMAVGQFEGVQYEGILHPLNADHLVISTELTGACAVADGCGLGANERCALQCVGGCCGRHQEEIMDAHPSSTGFKGLLSRVAELFAARQDPHPMTPEEHAARGLAREMEVWNEMHPSDGERHQMLRDALQAKFGGQDRDVMVADVFSESREVIFWLSTPLGPMPKGAEFFHSNFTEGEGGAFTFTEPTRVRRLEGWTSYRISNTLAIGAKAAGISSGGICNPSVANSIRIKKSFVSSSV